MQGSPLLLAEGDPQLGTAMHASLAADGYAVHWVTDGRLAEQALDACRFDLVVMDAALARCSAVEMVRRLRARADLTPVILISANSDVRQRVDALDSGADDFLAKPFDASELHARLRAVARRAGGPGVSRLQHGEIMVDLDAHTVLRAGQPVSVSPTEFTILRLLLDNRGAVLSRTRLEEALYGWDAEVESNTVEVHIHFLRKKLGRGLIRTVRGVGYVVDLPAGRPPCRGVAPAAGQQASATLAPAAETVLAASVRKQGFIE